MANDNHITIAGNLTADPELKFTAGGYALCKFTVAVNRRVKKGEEWEEQVSFFNCTAWRDQADYLAQSLQKGDRIIVTGRLEQRSWEADDGSKRSAVEIQVDEVGASLKSAVAQIQRIRREKAPSQSSRPTSGRQGGSRKPQAHQGHDDFVGEEPF